MRVTVEDMVWLEGLDRIRKGLAYSLLYGKLLIKMQLVGYLGLNESYRENCDRNTGDSYRKPSKKAVR